MQSLYLSYDGMTDQLGQSQVIPYLQKLSEFGHRFTIISFEKKSLFEKNKKDIELLLTQSNIEWIPLMYHKSPPVISTLWDFFCLLRKAKQVCLSRKVEVVHCRSYITALAGLSLKKKLSIQFIFDMRGFWADERSEGKIWDLKNPLYNFIYRYFKRKEKQLLTNADHVITLTETAKEIIQKWQLTKMPSITVIPCCADTNHFKRENVKEDALQNIRLNFGLDSTQIVLGYLGAIGTWYMLDEMLDFFKVLLKTNSSAKFLFVTNEASETILNSAAKRNIPVNTLIITSASRQEVPLFISLMSVSIFFIKPTFSKQASSPTKMAELLSMGIPVIANSGIGDSDRIIEKTDCGIICQEMNEASYASAISTITSLLQKQKTDLRQVALDYFSLKMGAERYSSVYKSLTNNFLDTDRIRINL